MRLKRLGGLALPALVVLACVFAINARVLGSLQSSGVAQPAQDADPISGEWHVTFHVHEMTIPGTFTFILDGTKITGTGYSDHTGAGTIRDGKWADGKLSFTLDFKKHESIRVTGVLKDGKLSGEFTTEGMTNRWEGIKR